MVGDGLWFPVNPAAGGESADTWAGVVAREQAVKQGNASGGHANGFAREERYRGRREGDLV